MLYNYVQFVSKYRDVMTFPPLNHVMTLKVDFLSNAVVDAKTRI